MPVARKDGFSAAKKVLARTLLRPREGTKLAAAMPFPAVVVTATIPRLAGRVGHPHLKGTGESLTRLAGLTVARHGSLSLSETHPPSI